MHESRPRDPEAVNGTHHELFNPDNDLCIQQREAWFHARHIILISVCSALISNSLEMLLSLTWRFLAVHVHWTW